MTDDKKVIDSKSSADNVERHLRTLEKTEDVTETLYYSQEQIFSAEELAKVINEARLNALLAQSNAFLEGLSSELEDFDEDSTN
jgi:predicted Holliday junction resolvase-like endonuclease